MSRWALLIVCALVPALADGACDASGTCSNDQGGEDPKGLRGKVAVVTGGAGGIGAAIVKALAREGCKVVLASRSLGNLEKVAAELPPYGGSPAESLVVQTDVTDAEQVDALVQKTVERFGRLDIMVSNSGGVTAGGLPETITPEAWRNEIALNLDSVFFSATAAAKVMMKQGGGKIINIASQAGKMGPFQMVTAGYGAAKAGVINLCESLASAWATSSINVNCVTPGVVSPITMIPGYKATYPDGTPKPPLVLSPINEEVADVVLFLASKQADRISGHDMGISTDYRQLLNSEALQEAIKARS